MLALGGLFATYDWLLIVFVMVSAVVLLMLPWLLRLVILSAFVPTLIAQQLFQPTVVDAEEEEALGEEDLSIVHRQSRPSPDRG